MIADIGITPDRARGGEGLWWEVQHGGGGLLWEQGQGTGRGAAEDGIWEKYTFHPFLHLLPTTFSSLTPWAPKN